MNTNPQREKRGKNEDQATRHMALPTASTISRDNRRSAGRMCVVNCKDERIKTANAVLRSFALDTKLRLCPTGYVLVEWSDSRGAFSRRWMTRGQDWYPVWHHKWGQGGTATIALSQLVRWVQGKPVMGISTWRHWAHPNCNLLRRAGDGGQQTIERLLAGGYPSEVPCVLCGDTAHIGDWWSLNKVSGPCCSMRAGCRQSKTVTPLVTRTEVGESEAKNGRS